MALIEKIDKLTESNYDFWSMQMKSLLISADLWKYPSGQSIKTASMLAADAEKWDQQDEKATAMIILNLSASQVVHIRQLQTSKSVWDRLKEVHSPSGPSKKVSLYKRLMNLSMSENGKISHHINAFTEVVDKLCELNITMPDELLVLILLTSLPKSYEHFVVAMEVRDTLPTLSVLKTKLLEEGARKGKSANGNLDDEEQKGFAAQSKPKKSNKKKDDDEKQKMRSEGRCFNCGKKSHYAKDCKAPKKKSEQEKAYAFNLTTKKSGETKAISEWCIDSGATSHMCANKSRFITFEEWQQEIELADNNCVVAQGRGSIRIKTTTCVVTLQDVLYVPNLNRNFISVGRALKQRLKVIFDDDYALLKTKDNEIIMKANEENNLFIFREEKPSCYQLSGNNAVKWHYRFGHLNYKSLNDLSNKDLVRGFDCNKIEKDTKCVVCMKSKAHVMPYPNASESRAKEKLQLVHTDVCGPFKTASIGGSHYFVTFIDDMSRRVFVYFLKGKDEVFEKFKTFKNMAEKQTGQKLKAIRSDNGREYVNKQFDQYLSENGIVRQLSTAYCPQQNGVAERFNRTLIEMARSMLCHSGLHTYLWAEAISTAAYLRNRCPTRALDDCTPYEAWTGRKPAVDHLRIFGALAVAHDKSRKNKFQPKGEEFYFVGYSLTSKAYRLYDQSNRRIVERRDVVFDETKVLGESENAYCRLKFFDEITEDGKNKTATNEDASASDAESSEDNQQHDSTVVEIIDESFEIADGTDPTYMPSNSDETSSPESENERASKWTGRPGRLVRQNEVLNLLNAENDISVPESYEEALQSEHSEEWKDAMQKEYASLIKNNTWSLVDLPKGQKTIGCKWVYSIKTNKAGQTERYKARLVAKGCSQQYGVNYFETFSPVVRYSTIRLVLALAAEYKMFVHQLDVTTAYLNSKLDEECYMTQPDGFINEQHPRKALKLNKAIYGLKQSGRAWNERLNSVLEKMGFTPCQNEPCLYRKAREGELVLIAVYVDDLFVAATTKDDLESTKIEIGNSFEIVDKGPISYFLGIEVERDGELGAISIGHKMYIKNLLRQYNMDNCRAVSVPIDPGYQLKKGNENSESVDQTKYQSLIGALMYLAVSTRPDIIHAASKLAQFNSNPMAEHMTAAKHVLRYLSKTMDWKLHYQQTGELLNGYVDADWGSNLVDRKSYSGYVYVLASGAISWESRKQSLVALSSTEAEYISLSNGAKEAIYLKRLLSEIGAFDIKMPVTIFCDNLSAQHIAKNNVLHSRTKHIDVKFHHVRELVKSNDIELKYISTNEMIADVLTKLLAKEKHCTFMKAMGLY